MPAWASAAWSHSWFAGLADPCWFILSCVGSSLANCFVWFVLSRELLLDIGILGFWAFGDTLEFLLVFICLLVGVVWTEAGQRRGDCSAFPAAVRGVVHQPYQSSNFLVVALGGGHWLIHVHGEGWGGCLWVVSDFGVCFWSTLSPLVPKFRTNTPENK